MMVRKEKFMTVGAARTTPFLAVESGFTDTANFHAKSLLLTKKA